MKAILVRNKYPQDPAAIWGRDILSFSPSCNSWTGSLVDCDDSDSAVIVCKDGRRLTVPPSGEHHSNYAHEGATYTRGKTVGEVMAEAEIDLAQVEHFEANLAGCNYTSGSADEDWDFTYWIYPQDGDQAQDCAIVEAARQFAAKKMGFAELKAIIKANS